MSHPLLNHCFLLLVLISGHIGSRDETCALSVYEGDKNFRDDHNYKSIYFLSRRHWNNIPIRHGPTGCISPIQRMDVLIDHRHIQYGLIIVKSRLSKYTHPGAVVKPIIRMFLKLYFSDVEKDTSGKVVEVYVEY